MDNSNFNSNIDLNHLLIKWNLNRKFQHKSVDLFPIKDKETLFIFTQYLDNLIAVNRMEPKDYLLDYTNEYAELDAIWAVEFDQEGQFFSEELMPIVRTLQEDLAKKVMKNIIILKSALSKTLKKQLLDKLSTLSIKDFEKELVEFYTERSDDLPEDIRVLLEKMLAAKAPNNVALAEVYRGLIASIEA